MAPDMTTTFILIRARGRHKKHVATRMAVNFDAEQPTLYFAEQGDRALHVSPVWPPPGLLTGLHPAAASAERLLPGCPADRDVHSGEISLPPEKSTSPSNRTCRSGCYHAHGADFAIIDRCEYRFEL
jgi:hypothetical protein